MQLGIAYEAGHYGFPENWDLAAKLYQTSAMQGWFKGQFEFGRAFQFGMGVPQDRQKAIAWYQRAAANGDPDGKYWAQWLSDPTNNIGFRDDEERSIVMDVAGRMQFAVGAGDPAGVTFHSSAQRALWLGGERQRVNSRKTKCSAKCERRIARLAFGRGRPAPPTAPHNGIALLRPSFGFRSFLPGLLALRLHREIAGRDQFPSDI